VLGEKHDVHIFCILYIETFYPLELCALNLRISSEHLA